MASLFLDGFDASTSATSLRGWNLSPASGDGSLRPTGGPAGSQALALKNTAAAQSLSVLAGGAYFYAAGWVRLEAFPAEDNRWLFGYVYGSSSTGQKLNLRADGLGFRWSKDGDASFSPSLTFPQTPLSTDTWYWVEMLEYSATSGGYVKLWLDGELAAELSGVSTPSPRLNKIGLRINGVTPALTTVFDDVVAMCGAALEDLPELPLGPKHVISALPNSTAEAGFDSPYGAATHHEAVDEPLQDGDSSYVSASSVGQRDLYGFTIPSGIGGVIAAGLYVCARKSGSGTSPTVSAVIKNADDIEVEKSVGTFSSTGQYSYGLASFLTDAEGGGWTESTLNAHAFGPELVAGTGLRVTSLRMELLADALDEGSPSQVSATQAEAAYTAEARARLAAAAHEAGYTCEARGRVGTAAAEAAYLCNTPARTGSASLEAAYKFDCPADVSEAIVEVLYVPGPPPPPPKVEHHLVQLRQLWDRQIFRRSDDCKCC